MQILRLTLSQWHEVDAALCIAASVCHDDMLKARQAGSHRIASQFQDQEIAIRKLMDHIGENKFL
jgi:hypothetical protein